MSKKIELKVILYEKKFKTWKHTSNLNTLYGKSLKLSIILINEFTSCKMPLTFYLNLEK